MADETMQGVILPGDSTVEFGQYPVPQPGHGQVLIRVRASSICGSDIRAIRGRAELPQGFADRHASFAFLKEPVPVPCNSPYHRMGGTS